MEYGGAPTLPAMRRRKTLDRSHLAAGMAVTLEIKTGKRRVIAYFLSPLSQYGNGSLRER
jgi:multidrug efflux pump subunit AcrA (membrane-fusion protein)